MPRYTLTESKIITMVIKKSVSLYEEQISREVIHRKLYVPRMYILKKQL